MKKSIIAVTLLAVTMLFSAVSSAKALSPPSWVPTKVAGWTLAYSAPLPSNESDIVIGNITLVSNWTQMWVQNSSDVLQGVVGVVDLQYSTNLYGEPLSSNGKAFMQDLNSSFTGTTVWDAVSFIFENYLNGQDVTSQISGASGAIAINWTEEGFGLYLLLAYAGAKVMVIFSLALDPTVLDWLGTNATSEINSWFYTYVGYIGFAFAGIATSIAELGTSSIAPQIHTSDEITSLTNASVLFAFANTYVPAAAPPASTIPGFSTALFGASAATGVIALLAITRKRRAPVV